MIRLALFMAVLAFPAPAQVSEAHQYLSPSEVRAGSDIIRFERVESGLQVFYNNGGSKASAQGHYRLTLEGIELRLYLEVSGNETLTVEPVDDMVIAEPSQIEVPDGESATLRIFPPGF